MCLPRPNHPLRQHCGSDGNDYDGLAALRMCAYSAQHDDTLTAAPLFIRLGLPICAESTFARTTTRWSVCFRSVRQTSHLNPVDKVDAMRATAYLLPKLCKTEGTFPPTVSPLFLYGR